MTTFAAARRATSPAAQHARNENQQGRRIEIRGIVQGVGFRPWVFRIAHELGLRGRVRNGSAGVAIDAFGPSAALDALVLRLRVQAPPAAAEISELRCHAIEPEPCAGFEIEPSRDCTEHRASIPADLPTCDRCLAELFDPGDRRYGYAFTNCTDCGPRFTITRQVPYDRANTSMAAFPMCDACRAEYESPGSRRFHAEPNACPQCGPRLSLLDAGGRATGADEPLDAAVQALAAGAVVAVKGLGGYHLACDATDQAAVAELRRRKRRDGKPFAVMCADLGQAETLVALDAAARRLLTGRERPIVLAPRRPAAPIAPAVSAGHDRVGVYLAYTPLHHLLVVRVARPLVMTSANRRDEPSIHRDADALEMLAGIADFFLLHDREIVTRTDDSVAAVIAARPVLLRRSRGYVPRAVALGSSGPVVLGCGAQLKNTFGLAVGDAAYLGPHMGDLESVETFDSFCETIEHMEQFLDVRPSVVAHDLHPDYLSTRYALARTGTRAVGVQHHHAHVAAVMAEHHLGGPVLGLAWDGAGLGTDGALWGGELLLADYAGFRRLATFRPIALAGGDTAVREIWRTALAVLDDAYDGEPPIERIAVFDDIEAQRIDTVRRMIAADINAPRVHGVGRWFDAVAAIGLDRAIAEHEGQAAMFWQQAGAAPEASAAPACPFDIDASTQPWQVDLRRTVRALTADRIMGVDRRRISASFHRTLVDIGRELIVMARAEHDTDAVVLGGGCFQNALLVEGLQRVLERDCTVYRSLDVPSGDGGLALGQIAVARARCAANAGEDGALGGNMPCV